MTEETIDNYIEVIQEANNLMSNYIKELCDLLKCDNLINICTQYENLRNEQTDRGFNIFEIIAPTHINWENLHSDVIAGFLRNPGMHNGGDKYLKLFIKLLNKIRPDLKIDVNEFHNANVEREKPIKIDISIQGTSKVIIIENKRDAGDRDRQMPRYFNHFDLKKDVVAIVYLTLDGKPPTENGWSSKDKKNIDKLLIKLATYSEHGMDLDLFHGWLQPCINITNDVDALCILRQYKKLIQTLKQNVMDMKIMKKFYEAVIVDKEKFETAKSISNIKKITRKLINQLNFCFLPRPLF